ncbi:MAG: glycosyltransferase family 4 protein [Methanotrichaceae archaeon]
MRIGMLSWESLYSIKIGGIAPHVSQLSEALASMGHEVHVFTRQGDFDAYDKINGVHYQRIDSDNSGDIIYQMNLMCEALFDRFERVQKIFGRFDMIHAHDWHPVLAANRIKFEHNIPYVFTIHSTDWGRNGNNFGNSDTSREISHREWLGGYESSQIIVTTKQMQDEIQKIYSIPESKINIVPNGIAKKEMRPLDSGTVKKKYGIYPLDPLVLFCGRINYQKGPDLLVEAIPLVLSKHSNAKFIFMGEGDMKSYCEDRARNIGVQNACRFLGYVPGPQKEMLIGACGMVCVPSRNEPFGVIILEAWEAGKPVVATEAIGIIKNFEDGILAYIQPESIAWCINRLLDNPSEMNELGKAGKMKVEAEFRWDKIAEKTEEVYDKAVRVFSSLASIRDTKS